MRYFVYINSYGEIKSFAVKAVKEDEIYLYAYSDEKERTITFRKDRIIQDFSNIDEANRYLEIIPDTVINQFLTLVSSHKKELSYKSSALQTITFCFTGFKKEQKEKLQKLVAECKLHSVTDVSTKVDYLVVCENSKTIGPSKLAKAEKYGIKVIYENQFIYMLETGEIPE
ncbi:BRCT domain-containing protein [Gallibacterium anatis]|uniref:BRCT domain-containing protein n=1 Tax=Gallibacterium anatis TaxID=750 RepID=UPI000531B226|nr:BRCT domain-containing protein [Gallibacterium anatis]KGQ25842.1 hypothetical protein JP27_07360 [Gallibacterium anatis]